MKQVFNPYLPLNEYVPDGEPHVFGNRVYIYGSHDLANGKKYCEGNYVTWSAAVDNLKEWRYEGVIYERKQDPSNEDGLREMWAPDVTCGPDGRYYLYYCLAFYPEIGVAVSDSPKGPFAFYGHVKYPNHILDGKVLREHMPFDPAVLTDDDGKVYLYYGFSHKHGGIELNPEAWEKQESSEEHRKPIEQRLMEKITLSDGGMAVELESDMLTVKTEPYRIIPGLMYTEGTGFQGHGFFEASSIRKVNDSYYFVYSSELSHELCYAISDKPMSDFQFGGTIVSGGDIGLNGREKPVNTVGNNHGGMVQIGSDWYIFYHRQTNGTEFSRQGCAEKIDIQKDGSIKQVPVTSCGLNGGPLIGEGSYNSVIACHLTGTNTTSKIDYFNPIMNVKPMIVEKPIKKLATLEDEIDIEHYITNIKDGTLIGYKYFQFTDLQHIEIVLKGKAEAVIHVFLDEEGKEKVGSKEIKLDANDWTTVEIPIILENGTHALYFFFEGRADLSFLKFSFVNRE